MLHSPVGCRVLAPAERHSARSVGALLDERLVELAAGARMDLCPAVLAVVLQARHVGAEERRELPPAARSLAFVAHLIVENVRLHLNLKTTKQDRKLIADCFFASGHNGVLQFCAFGLFSTSDW